MAIRSKIDLRTRPGALKARRGTLKRVGRHVAVAALNREVSARRQAAASYKSENFPAGTKVFRGSTFRENRIPEDIGFFAVDRFTAMTYATAKAMTLTPTRTSTLAAFSNLRLFVMTPDNLGALAAAHADDKALVSAIRNVTGVGLQRWQKYERANDGRGKIAKTIGRCAAAMCFWGATGGGFADVSPMALSGLAMAVGAAVLAPKNAPRKTSNRSDKLQVHTEGYLTAANKQTGVYASKRLALEMKRILKPMGFDGWVYKAKGAVRAVSEPIGTASSLVQFAIHPSMIKVLSAGPAAYHLISKGFHEEIMLWNSQTKLSNAGLRGFFTR